MSSTSSSSSDSIPSSSTRGAGFSMKTLILSIVFGIFASSAQGAMMGMGMPGMGMGMDPMMGMHGMPPMGMGGMGMMPPMGGMSMGMPMGGMGMMPPTGMGMMPTGYRYKRGRRYGLLGLRRRPGHWKPTYGYRGMGMGMPPMGMGMGMGMPPMGMGMGMPMY